MRSRIILFLAISFLIQSCKEKESTPQDWPQFKKDNYRSANSPVQLDLSTFGEDWEYTASQMPSPAWYGPAKEDTYAKSGPLPSMRDYDLSFYPIVVGTKLYYGSTADDAIHCLDTKTGIEKWIYTTGGPIRIAPVYHKGKLYFGSDDGYAYCIDASNGNLVWRLTPKKSQPKKVMNNNSLISFWPIRTGLLIENGIAYFGASLLPWKESYFCAVNIKTGKPDIKETYIKKYDDLTLEGAMASTGTKIIQPQGRISPIFFNKSDGVSKGQLAGTGGCFVLVTPELNIVHPQTSREKSIIETLISDPNQISDSNGKKAQFMTFKGGKEMVVNDSVSYILTDNSISAYNRNTKKVIWLQRNYQAHRIILAGDVLYVGGTDKVYGVSTKNGLPIWESSVNGTVNAIIVADNALFASTREGSIYCFRNGFKNNALLEKNKDELPEIAKEEIVDQKVEGGNFDFFAGPFINAIDPNTIEIHFITKEPMQCSVNWKDGFGQELISESSKNTDHRIIIPHVRKDFNYQYQIVSGDERSKFYEYDNMFNYTKHKTIKDNTVQKTDNKIADILKLNPSNKGVCIVLGEKNKELALDIATNSDMKVLLFERSESKVDQLRKEWQKTSFYGSKIAVHQVSDYSNLPITSDIAEVVLVNDPSIINAKEIIRLVKPEGYAVLLGKEKTFKKWLSSAKNLWQVDQINKDSKLYLKKKKIENIGKWTHQYGLADNSAFGGESLWGSTSTEDFEIQWMGRPGPRFQTDRSGRKPSPLATNGKMFVQGKERVLAIDTYNGKIFWSKEIPEMVRMNLHHDCSNWAADDDFLYITVNQNLIKLNSQNGKIDKIFPVDPSKNNIPNEWGYIGVLEDKMIGSSTQKGSAFKNYYGGVGWYDAQTGPMTYKVMSFALFAKSKEDGKEIWKYEKPTSAIINSTITISNKQISFVESRNPKMKLSKEGRGKSDIFKELYMVSLDVDTGKVNWEKKLDTEPGITTYFMAASKDYNVIVSSFKGNYYIYTYNATNGDLVWAKEQSWFADNHGGHLSRPAIVKNKLIVKPAIYKLDSGEKLKMEIPKAGHGCASYALSEQSTFYRGGSVTQFNFDTDKFSKWERLRPDCWISTIPAQGMVLSPEAGGGCSCGNWLETSMVFAPISRAPLSLIYKEAQFIDSLSIEIKARNISNKNIYYTLDGSEPSKNSKQYTSTVIISKNTILNTIIYVEKEGKEIAFTRTKEFTRTYPEPVIKKNPQLVNGNWVFFIKRTGVTGEIHYTTDGSTPDKNSPKYDKPVTFLEKILIKAKTFWIDNGKEIVSKETSAELIIPKLIESISAEVKPGIERNFYKVKYRDMPNFNSVKPDSKKIINQIDLKSIEDKGKFALHFKGYLNIKEDGLYTIFNQSGGDSYVYLHDKKILINESNTEKSTVLGLKKGLHPIIVNYKIWRGNPNLKLQIEGPDMPKEAIDKNMLKH